RKAGNGGMRAPSRAACPCRQYRQPRVDHTYGQPDRTQWDGMIDRRLKGTYVEGEEDVASDALESREASG
ncbi:hypothetical protein PENTCL1PPCAC_10721, partial [Pristionchus entomophagus]